MATLTDEQAKALNDTVTALSARVVELNAKKIALTTEIENLTSLLITVPPSRWDHVHILAHARAARETAKS
jgi:hypothetical protein